MEMECSIARERNHFLRKLTTNPLFLLQHVPALAQVFWQRYQRKRNHKRYPAWLIRQSLHQDNRLNSETIWHNIPQRVLTMETLNETKKATLCKNHQDNKDHEDYLAKHRFTELLNWACLVPPYTLPQTILTWLANPPAQDDAAWETYSSCERVANLLTWISFIPRAERHALPATIAPFLFQSLTWISQHLEYYREHTNNHILNNARTLIMLGVALDHEAAILQGLTILKHMLPVLLQTQGTLRERSTHYQLIVLNWMLDVIYFLQNAKSIAKHAGELAIVHDSAIRMRDAAASFCNPDGFLLAYIGDISPDATPLQTTERLKKVYPIFWPSLQCNARDESQQTTLQQIDDFYLLHHQQQQILMNCPQGAFPPTYPTHGHNDFTSFVWCYAGDPILIDTGRARYNKEAIPLRQKSGLGHNIALVNGFPPTCESLVLQGQWWPKPYAKTKVSHAQQNLPQSDKPLAIVITHDGFRRATPVLKHTRKIFFAENHDLCIEDAFLGKPKKPNDTVTIKTIWQIHPDFVVDWMARSSRPTTSAKGELLNLCSQRLMLTLDSNAEAITTATGWHTIHYGEHEKHTCVILTWQVKLPFVAKACFKVSKRCVA